MNKKEEFFFSFFNSGYAFIIFLDIVDIKPVNMEELTEVITAAEFHPTQCHWFVYSSSKGSIRLCDMRDRALCDIHAKCKWIIFLYAVEKAVVS